MNLADKRVELLERLNDPRLSNDEKAVIRCRLAAECIYNGQYEAAQDYLGELWRGIAERPRLKGLTELAQAEVLLQCGTLTGWLGSNKQVKNAQEAAKDLLSEARRIFTKRRLPIKVAETQYELGMCYWRLGAFDEGRIVLRDALLKLGNADLELQAKILIRSTIIEIGIGRYYEALNILNEAAPVFDTVNDAIKGKWYAQKAITLRRLGGAEHLDQAIIEYTAAIHHLALAKHERYCANNLNNLAFLLGKLGRYDEAHQNLDRAQDIFTRLNDPGNIAQVNETRARILLSEGRLDEALIIIKSAVSTLERGGEYALLADAMVVQATILARLSDNDRSLPLFRYAINLAEDSGALTNAGLAALTMIEEQHKQMSYTELLMMYRRADDLLNQTQDTEAITRLRACARLVMQGQVEPKLSDPDFSLNEVMKAYEYGFIKQALEEEGGSVSRAAKRLGISWQTIGYIIKTRHRDLLGKRTPIKKRRRSIIKYK